MISMKHRNPLLNLLFLWIINALIVVGLVSYFLGIRFVKKLSSWRMKIGLSELYPVIVAGGLTFTS